MKRDREKGAVAVEFALAMPALLIIVFAGLHLGRAISARSRIVDAAGFAARAEAIRAGKLNIAPSDEQIRAMVTARMAGTSECTNVETVTEYTPIDPYRYLKVRVTCTLSTIGAGVISLGLNEVSASAAFPVDSE